MEEHIPVEALDLDDDTLPRFDVVGLSEHEPGTPASPQHPTEPDLDIGLAVIRGDRRDDDDL